MRSDTPYFDANSGDFDAFVQQVSRQTNANDAPQACDIIHDIPIYDGALVNDIALNNKTQRQLLMQEWTNIFRYGAGIIVIKNGIDDIKTIDRANEIFNDVIEKEKISKNQHGDHFAKAGSNDRIWNILQKHCLYDPHNFACYYASHAIAMAAEAWLGLGYQITAQVNRVNPGGDAQRAHRDYHLGFMSVVQMTGFPAHIHAISPYLTLQGAIAHGDMPIESGPTKLLPFSQQFLEGYIAINRNKFQDYFEKHYVQLPLKKGDMMFLNPAIIHAAGRNLSSDIYRMVNLLQISSPFGRAMENINRQKMCLALAPILLKASQDNSMSPLDIQNIIYASAESYSFPTNLDNDPPIDNMAPKTQSTYFFDLLADKISLNEFIAELTRLQQRQQA